MLLVQFAVALQDVDYTHRGARRHVLLGIVVEAHLCELGLKAGAHVVGRASLLPLEHRIRLLEVLLLVDGLPLVLLKAQLEVLHLVELRVRKQLLPHGLLSLVDALLLEVL